MRANLPPPKLRINGRASVTPPPIPPEGSQGRRERPPCMRQSLDLVEVVIDGDPLCVYRCDLHGYCTPHPTHARICPCDSCLDYATAEGLDPGNLIV